jgi:hypothetical protein|tara:strand:- start:559 stop:738 length:180 start_codon:yes stop_codon:yes gene_type:complete
MKKSKKVKNLNELNKKNTESITEKTVIEKLKSIPTIEKARMMYLIKREMAKQNLLKKNK